MTTLLVLRAGIRSGEIAIQASGGAVAIVSAGFLIAAVLRSMQLRGGKVVAPAAWMMVIAAIALGLAGLTSTAAFIVSRT